MKAKRVVRWMTAGAVVLIAVAGLAIGCGRRKPVAQVQTVPVQRRDIAVTIEATGTVEPIDLVEVKSKASGQIVHMPVKAGAEVPRGALLAQIDPTDVNNQYRQTAAALQAAQAKAQISAAQKKRAEALFAQGVIAAPEAETARLDYANARASLVKARTDLDIARQRRAEATVRAPISGTILEQPVAEGQVIASATSNVSGGTTLLKMADLSRIRLRALVSETDIGSVRPGQSATVTVDAFPDRPFTGTVEKIEPQAVVQQSVTLFPVLISIANEQRMLLPGMNGEVSMLTAEHDDVPAVPMDAVRGVREIPAVALALGLDPEDVRAEVQRQIDERRRERAAEADTAAPAAYAGGGATSADSTSVSRRGDGARAGGRGARWGGGRSADGARGAWSDSARARWRAGRGGPRSGDAAGPGEATRGGGGAGTGGGWRRGGAGAGGGGASGGAGFAGNAGGASGGNGRRAQVVFVKTAKGLEPRLVRIGLSNFDYAEVLGGVREGEEVALLTVAELQSERQQNQSRMRERMGGGVPGASGAGGGRGGVGGRGGGGGR